MPKRQYLAQPQSIALFRRFLESNKLSINEAGERFGIHHQLLSGFLRGSLPLTKGNIFKIIDTLAEDPARFALSAPAALDLACDLLRAWISDYIGPKWLKPLSDYLAGLRGNGDPERGDPRRAALAYFDRLSRENPEIADWLIASRAIIEDPKNIAEALAAASQFRQAQAQAPENPLHLPPL